MKKLTVMIALFVLPWFAGITYAQDTIPGYREENVLFTNGEATYSGTLSMPAREGIYPLLILVSGMGPQTRDWKFGSNYKMAKIIADYLNSQNIAVYRYDDRGTGKSTGGPETLTSFDVLADDVYAAVKTLRQRPDIGKIGLCGHSLGGILSVLAASKHSDIDFIITLSGSFQSGGAIMMEQAHTLKRWKTSENMTETAVIANGEKFVRNWVSFSNGGAGLDTMKQILSDLIHYQINNLPPEKMAENLKTYKDTNALYVKSYEDVLDFYTSAHQKSFAVYDPVKDFPAITCPVLVMFGEKDAHVVVASNKPAVASALKEAKTMDFTLKIIPGVDHGYSTKELYKQGLMGPGALECLSGWIITRTTSGKNTL
jgi:uncharacterized protein